MPFLAVRKNEVVAVSSRTRVIGDQEWNARKCGQLVIVSVVGLLINHHGRSWDFFSAH